MRVVMMKLPLVPFVFRKQSLGVLTVLLALCLSGTVFGAQSLTLAWDQNSEPDVIGYKVHYGQTSGSYTQTLDVGNATNATLSSLVEGQTYYFAVSAYDTSALESALSNEIQFTVPVLATNNPPVAGNATVTTAEDKAKSITLNGSDVDGDPLTYAVVTQPTHGSLSGTAPNLTYRPGTNFFGSDSFTFRVSDGMTNSATAIVSITVTAVNDPPVVSGSSVTTAKNTPVVITLTGSDVDGDALTYAVVTQPAHGTLSGQPPNLTYTPQPNYNGPDSFTFKANDGTVDSSVAAMSITVTAINSAPLASGTSVTTSENTPANFLLSASDPDGDALIYTVVTAPTHGSLSGAAPNLMYQPNTNYNGVDSFTFQVSDGVTNSSTATVSITVTRVNDAPVANATSLTTVENTAKSITLSGSDVDGDALTYAVVTQPAHGTLSGTAPNLTYTPAANYNGADSFTFKVNDGAIDSGAATVAVTVSAVNSPPVADNATVTTKQNNPVNILLSGSDPDGDTLTYTVVRNPRHGSLIGQAPNLAYAPQANYLGSDNFTFRVNDGTVNSALATISITIVSNSPPVAVSAAVTTAANTPVNIFLSGSDPNGDTLTYTVVAGPTNGTLSGQAPDLRYTPQTSYSGTDGFTFKVNDGTVDSVAAAITITVAPADNDVPSISSLTMTDSGVQLIWNAIAGKTYRVLYKDGLGATNWSVGIDEMLSGGSSLYWVDHDAPNVPQRFYRIEVVTP